MEKIQDKGFKIFGEDVPEIEEETIIPDVEVDSPPAAASGSKSVFIAVFTFCVLGALLFFGYYQLNNRMTRLEATGINELKGLSDELETRLADIAKQNAEQNTVLKEQLNALSEELHSSSTMLTGLEKTLTTTKKSTESNISSVESRLEATAGRINTFESGNRKAIESLDSKLAKLDRAVDDTRSTLSGMETLRKELRTMQTRTDTLSSQLKAIVANRVDTANIDQQFSSLKRDFARRLESTENQVQKDVFALQNEITALEAMIRSLKAGAAAGRSSSYGSTPRGDIIEQEIE